MARNDHAVIIDEEDMDAPVLLKKAGRCESCGELTREAVLGYNRDNRWTACHRSC
jgi:hypothetical protein